MKLYVKVIANSKQEKIEWITDNSMKVHLKQPAENGKANQELIKFLKKEMKKEIHIVSGFKKHRKIIEVKEAI